MSVCLTLGLLRPTLQSVEQAFVPSARYILISTHSLKSMKLKRIVKNEPVVRLAVSIKASTMTRLEAYQEYYKSAYGEDIERSTLVEEMLRELMNSDKDFVKTVDSKGK